MADEFNIDITSDLNGMGDAQPYHGNDVPQNRQNQPANLAPEAPDPKDAQDAPLSVREALTRAMKEGKAAEQPGERIDPPLAAPAIPPIAPAASPPAAPDLIKVGDRFHNRDGTFASAEQIAAFNAGQHPGQAPVDPAALAAAQPQFFSQLTPVEQQQFAALPAEIRQFVERRMEAVNNLTARYSEYDMLEQQLIGPRREAWAQAGANPVVAINQLLGLSDFAGRDPANFVMWFADQHRLDLDAMLDARDAAMQQGAAPDPRFNGIEQQLAQLSNTVNGFIGQNSEQQQAARVRTVNDFVVEKDAQGNLINPFFAEVANDIGAHVQALRQQQPYLGERELLKAAYDFAVWNNPSTRARLQESQMQALKATAQAEAQRARQAGGSINGGPAADGNVPVNSNRSVRETIIDAVRQQTV